MLIRELTTDECVEVLTHLRLGRLGCSRDGQPYVVPFNFAYHDKHLYGVSTLGQKIEWMRTNPRVCVETDELVDHSHWTSVVVQGRYEELPDTPEWSADRECAYALLQRRPMWWEPACVGKTQRGAVEQVIPLYFRIHIERVTGRRAKPDPVDAATWLEPAPASRSTGWLKRLLNVARRGATAASDVHSVHGDERVDVVAEHVPKSTPTMIERGHVMADPPPSRRGGRTLQQA